MSDERLPQRFRYRKPSCNGWDFGVVYPMGQRWKIDAGAGFGSFESDPWEMLGHIIGDVAEFQWIDNDHGWAGDVMPREGESKIESTSQCLPVGVRVRFLMEVVLRNGIRVLHRDAVLPALPPAGCTISTDSIEYDCVEVARVWYMEDKEMFVLELEKYDVSHSKDFSVAEFTNKGWIDGEDWSIPRFSPALKETQ